MVNVEAAHTVAYIGEYMGISQVMQIVWTMAYLDRR